MNRFRRMQSYYYVDNTDGRIVNPALPAMRDYSIYGSSIQDGTPTPDNPVEVQSVGDLVTEGEHAGKYKIPVNVNGANAANIYLDEPLRKIGDKADYIDFANKKVVRNIGKFDLNGDVVVYPWRINGNTSHGIRTSPPVFNQMLKTGAGMSNRESYFNQSSNNPHAMWTLQYYLYWVKILDVLGIYSDTKTNDEMIAEFKTWIENNPTYVCYPLTTPVSEAVDLPAVKLGKNTNIITVGTAVQPSAVNWQYYKY